MTKLLAAPVIVGGLSPVQARSVTSGDVVFNWGFSDAGFTGEMTARTRGWIAAGLNMQAGLRGTRLIMAAPHRDATRVEEHIALVPDHQTVASLGAASALVSARTKYTKDMALLQFAMRADTAAPWPLKLSEGQDVHLTLAWSNDPDLQHHSAWRRHFIIRL